MDGLNLYAYIRPELFIVALIACVFGTALKRTAFINDKYIPGLLGGGSILMCLLYFLSAEPILNFTMFFEVLFESVVQGIFIAACAVYGNQFVKQLGKKE